jgi:hypothetical protein
MRIDSFSTKRREHFPNHPNQGRQHQNTDDDGQHTTDERHRHKNRDFMCFFFRTHFSLFSHFGRVCTQSLAHTGSKLRRLDEKGGEGPEFFHSSASGHPFQCIFPAPSSTQLQHHRSEQFGKLGVADGEFAPNAIEGSIHPKAGLNAYKD